MNRSGFYAFKEVLQSPNLDVVAIGCFSLVREMPTDPTEQAEREKETRHREEEEDRATVLQVSIVRVTG